MDAAWLTAYATVALAVGTVPLAIATIVLAVAAWRQLPLIAGQVNSLAEQIGLTRRAEENTEQRHRRWETLKACERYDFDPVIDAACQRLYASSNKGTDYKDSRVDKRDIVVLLNYLDGLAIGIEQQLYVEDLVRGHLELIVMKCVDEFLATGIVSSEGYERLLRLTEQWKRARPAQKA